MDLTVVIVSYNVKHFLEQCLQSVMIAMDHTDGEVFVVDNNSVDGSGNMVRQKFPSVRLIENKSNIGFSKANNQALIHASGKYCLLLNPDTLVEERSFRKCIDFMEKNPDAGALGVKMVNGKGKYLPESKRSLPEPSVAFYKIFGLSALFPHSKLFSGYNLGHLDENKTNAVDIVSGAYMFIRRDALLKTGLLDEEYFMYGEDIDLSYRLIKNGYTNYYFPETTIIHYKGESTKKGTLNYVLFFYKAMIIFARKHFSRKNAWLLSFIINIAIYFRAFISILKRIFLNIYQPVLDLALICSGYFILTPFWGEFRFNDAGYYPEKFYNYVVPLYGIIWSGSILLSGGYKKPVKLRNFFSGLFIGTIIILVIYALTPAGLRFSRALILMGMVWSALVLVLYRFLLKATGLQQFAFASGKKKRLVVVGKESEAARVSEIYRKAGSSEIIGHVFAGDDSVNGFLGTIEQLSEVVRVHRIETVVFCAGDVSWGDIIKAVTLMKGLPVDFKVEFEGNDVVIKSQ